MHDPAPNNARNSNALALETSHAEQRQRRVYRQMIVNFEQRFKRTQENNRANASSNRQRRARSLNKNCQRTHTASLCFRDAHATTALSKTHDNKRNRTKAKKKRQPEFVFFFVSKQQQMKQTQLSQSKTN